MGNIRKHILCDLGISGLNFDNGFGYTDDESYNIVRGTPDQNCLSMRKHAHKLFEYAINTADELGINKSKLYITIYGYNDTFVLTNSNHSYAKVTLCGNSEVLLFIGDENYMRPNERLIKTYTSLDIHKKFNTGGMKTITQLSKEEKIAAIIKRFNEGKIL